MFCLLAIAGCHSAPPASSSAPMTAGNTVTATKPGDGAAVGAAVKLETRPVGPSSPIRSQLVVIATVTDAQGAPHRKQKVEWNLEGGNILKVDERKGPWLTAGTKGSPQHAISYTAWSRDRLDLGTGDPADVIVIEPGQTWVILTSASEGTSQLSAVCSGNQ